MSKSKYYLIIALLLSFLGCSPPEKIKIAFLGPLTGGLSDELGRLTLEGVRLAVEERNNNGGIGNKKIELLLIDTEGKPDKALEKTKKLINTNEIYGVIGPVYSSVGLKVAPYLQEKKIVTISPTASHIQLTNEGSYIFRLTATNDLQAKILAFYLYQKLNIKNMGILSFKSDAYSSNFGELFRKNFTAAGGNVLAEETFSEAETDYTRQLRQIEKSGVKALFLPLYAKQAGNLLLQLQKLGIKNLKIFGSDTLSGPDFGGTAGGLVDGVIFSNVENAEGGRVQDFRKYYRKVLKKDPENFSLRAYDSTNILLDGIEKTNELLQGKPAKPAVKKEMIQKEVASLKRYDGVSGMFCFQPNGDVVRNIGIYIYRKQKILNLGNYGVKDGKIILRKNGPPDCE